MAAVVVVTGKVVVVTCIAVVVVALLLDVWLVRCSVNPAVEARSLDAGSSLVLLPIAISSAPLSTSTTATTNQSHARIAGRLLTR